MKLLGLLFPLLVLVTLVGFIWLVVVAFKRSVGWGIGVLLLSPFSAIVFAVKYWQESKKPFLIYIGSVSASIAMMFVLFASLGGFAAMSMAQKISEGQVGEADVTAFIEGQFDRMENSGLLDDREREQLQEIRQMMPDPDGAEEYQPSTAPAPVAVEPEIRQVIARVAETPEEPAARTGGGDRDLVPMGEVDRHIGKLLRVTDEDGRSFIGHLVSVDEDELIFEKHLRSGRISVAWERSEIQSLHGVRSRAPETSKSLAGAVAGTLD